MVVILMETIKLQAERQKLSICSEIPTLVVGSYGEYHIVFSFSDDWELYDKRVVFSNRVKSVEVDYSNSVMIPWEMLECNGILSVGVYGTTTTNRKPTLWCTIGEIKKGTEPTIVSNDNTPSDVYTEIMARADAAVNAAETARDVTISAASDAIEQAQDALLSANSAVDTANTHAYNAEISAKNAKDSETSSKLNENNAASSASDALNFKNLAENAQVQVEHIYDTIVDIEKHTNHAKDAAVSAMQQAESILATTVTLHKQVADDVVSVSQKVAEINEVAIAVKNDAQDVSEYAEHVATQAQIVSEDKQDVQDMKDEVEYLLDNICYTQYAPHLSQLTSALVLETPHLSQLFLSEVT